MANTSALIESTLVSAYGVPKEEAARLQQELFLWFHRLARRPGTSLSVQALRTHLLSMTCKVGHVFWMAKSGARKTENEKVKRTLALGPDIIASELEKQIEETEGRLEQ
jgi:hypothetical protein